MSTSTMSRSTRIRSRIVSPLLAAGLLAATGSALHRSSLRGTIGGAGRDRHDCVRSDTHPDHRVVRRPGHAHRSGAAG